ncbi:MAG TPA: DUF5996 family protein [Promineifilum sp.]
MTLFPSLNGFGPTRETLQYYARAVSALARAHVPAHPHWWHVSLRVTPTGLITSNIPTADHGILTGSMNFQTGEVVMESSDGRSWTIPMTLGLSGREMGGRVMAIAAEAGLAGPVEAARFDSDEAGVYDPELVMRFQSALVLAHRAFTRDRARLGIDAGPIQLWPHNFDLATEWFGTRVERYNEGGRTIELPAQLNLGFYPGDDDAGSYFYSSPWPFDSDELLGQTLPRGAVWHTEGWQGAMLPYTAVRDEDQLLEFASAVFEIASPLLR